MRRNEMVWKGAVTKVGQPSDGVPCGGVERTVFDTDAVNNALSTMVGMPLNCVWPEEWWNNPAYALTGHDGRFCIGYVKSAWIEGDYFMCEGIIWKDNFSDLSYMIQNAKDALGFSVEVYPNKYEIEEDGFCHVKELEFAGLCICWKNVAAFEDTFLTELIAAKRKVGNTVDFEKMQEMLDAMVEKINASNKEIVAGLEAKVNELSEQVEKLNAEKAELEEKLSAAEAEKVEMNEKLEAAKANIPAPTAGIQQAPAPKDKVDFAAKRNEINKMNISEAEKVQLRYKAYCEAVSE